MLSKEPPRGTIFDPAFRSERARIAGAASQAGPAIVTRFLNAARNGKLSPADIARARAGLDEIEKGGAGS